MRVLITGLSTYWGGRLAAALERDPAVEAVIGIDRRPPKIALERTEYVEVADAHGDYAMLAVQGPNARALLQRLTDAELPFTLPAKLGLGARGDVGDFGIATDLELATLGALGREERMTDAECRALPPDALERARAAVEQAVVDKIENFVWSGGRARGDQ